MTRLRHSIGRLQALAVLVASLVAGAVLSAVQLQHELSGQRAGMHQTATELLDLTERAATNAAWTLDDALARDVIASIGALPGLRAARIRDEYRQKLAEVERQSAPPRLLREWIRSALDLDDVREVRELKVIELGKPRTVGELEIEVDGGYIADRFLREVQVTVVVTVTQALLIGVVLLWLSTRLVTGPLRDAATQIERIDPNIPSQVVDIPERHEQNELGQLLMHTNSMLARLFSTQEELRQLATRDPLTSLPNRTAIGDALHGAIERAKRTGGQVAVLFIDLDGFKEINDVLGHETGDDLLRSIATSLRDTLRGVDSLGRLGGDEFLVVLEDFDSVEAVVDAAARISRAVGGSVRIGAHQVRHNASIGIALYPDDGADVGTLMRHADMAMYRAKEEGGGDWVLFATEMSDRMQSRLAIRTALDRALADGELFLVYQPKFCGKDNELSGCEALLRWRRHGEVVSAAEFLSVAENTAQIVEIGRWVVDEACAQARAWNDRFGPVKISVNVSARQLGDAAFFDDVMAALARHSVDPSLLELEITETAAIANMSRSVDLLGRLRRAGVQTSLDDFGTGYSSLSYLVQLPFSTLKVDRAFVSGKHPSPVMLQAIMAMAGALRMQTVAEGVETAEQLALVQSLGCDQVQGFYTGRPAPPLAFAERYLKAAGVASRSA